MGVQRAAKQHAIVGSGAAVVRATAGHRVHILRQGNGGSPQLPSCQWIQRDRGVCGGFVHDTVDEQRLTFLRVVIGQAEVPDGDQATDVGSVDLLQRTVPLQIVATPVSGDVSRGGGVIEQVFFRWARSKSRYGRE